MRQYFCVYCGKPVSHEPWSGCCGEIGHAEPDEDYEQKFQKPAMRQAGCSPLAEESVPPMRPPNAAQILHAVGLEFCVTDVTALEWLRAIDWQQHRMPHMTLK